MEKDIRSHDPETLKKYKQEILDKVAEVIDKGYSFILIGKKETETMAVVNGTPAGISEMLAQTMAEVQDIKHILKLTVEAYDFASEMANKMVKKKTVPEEFNSIQLLKDDMGCETCDIKDECAIFNSEVMQGGKVTPENIMKLINEVKDKHPDLVKPMGKGGDA